MSRHDIDIAWADGIIEKAAPLTPAQLQQRRNNALKQHLAHPGNISGTIHKDGQPSWAHEAAHHQVNEPEAEAFHGRRMPLTEQRAHNEDRKRFWQKAGRTAQRAHSAALSGDHEGAAAHLANLEQHLSSSKVARGDKQDRRKQFFSAVEAHVQDAKTKTYSGFGSARQTRSDEQRAERRGGSIHFKEKTDAQ